MRDQRVLILGGTSGIGFATAKQALDLGAYVTITGRTKDSVAQAKARLGKVDTWVGDITREKDTVDAFAQVGVAHHVFLSGGGSVFGHVATLPQSELERIIRERIWAVIYVARCAAAHMTSGSITLMSGAVASRPAAGAAIKHAVLSATEGLARGLALELAPLRVNAIAPGYTETTALTDLLGDDPAARIREMSAGLPLKRVGTAEEVAQAVIGLMTNGFINGEVLHIDGGARFVAPAISYSKPN